jgi:hypothetical protein
VKLIERAEVSLEWLDASNLYDHPYQKHKRSTDREHVSEIIRRIAIQSNLLTDSDRDDDMPTCVLLGMGWEMACAKLYPTMEWQPGEVERDGIAGSPDGESILDDSVWALGSACIKLADAGELMIDEFKYTKKSCRKPGGGPDDYKDLADDWLWATQVKAYCAMHELQPRLVRFHVLWARGNYDYKGGGVKERYIRYLYRLDDQEVERNWQMILKHRSAESATDGGTEDVVGTFCKACLGTGMSSKGGKCHPCRGKGRKI